MPVYKTRETYLRTAIESILNQTYTDFEFLILDDCPDDTREDIIKSYTDSRIKYVKNERNLGITGSRNKLISMAKGEYLAVMDHDDISAPMRFAKEVKVLDENPEIGVVGANIHKIVANKDVIQPEFDEEIKIGLMMKCVINHPSSMIRKSLLTKNNISYEEHYSPAEDYKLWCNLIGVTKFYNIQEVLLHYRDWKGSTTNSWGEKMDTSTLEIWAENEINYPMLWKTFDIARAQKVQTIRLFNCIPFLKIVEKGRRKHMLLFDFIPLLSIKNSVKIWEKEKDGRFITNKFLIRADESSPSKQITPQISVIIPVYNVERYLPRCLDSVLAQTFADFEVICINDGSSDNSENILLEYAKKDNRITIITQKNQGAAVARNTGIEHSKGEWISFVDADDVVHPEMLSILYNQALLHGVEFIHFAYQPLKTFYPTFQKINVSSLQYMKTDNPVMITCKKRKFSNTLGPVDKFYKRTLIGDTRFIPHLQFEDYPFVYEILSKKPKSLFLTECLYFFEIRQNSLSRKPADIQQIIDYSIGIRKIFDVYSGERYKSERLFLMRDFLPIILKQQLGKCCRADDSCKKYMFSEFQKELYELFTRGLITWRGHKLPRYFEYKKLIKLYQKELENNKK